MSSRRPEDPAGAAEPEAGGGEAAATAAAEAADRGEVRSAAGAPATAGAARAGADAGADLARQVAAREGVLRLTGLRGAARAVVVAELALAEPERPVLVLCSDAKATDAFAADLRAALGEPADADAGAEEGRVRVFPHPDTPPYDRFSPQAFVVAQRMDVLHRLATGANDATDATDGQGAPGARGPAPVIAAPWTALALRVPAREAVRARSVRLRRGAEIDRDALVARLVAAGYARQPLVEERGEIAVRGGIVDIYPPQRARPVRIELLGDEVESIRAFDPASQRSEAALEEVEVPPARELLAGRELVVERADALRARGAQLGLPGPSVDVLVDQLLRGALPPGVEALAPLIQPAQESFLDYLPGDALLVVDEPESGRQRLERFDTEAREAYAAAREAGRLVCEPDALLLGAAALEEAVEARRPVHLERLEVEAPGVARALHTRGHGELSLALRRARSSGSERPLRPLIQALGELAARGQRIVLAAPALSGATRLVELLGEYGVTASLAREPAPAPTWSAPAHVEVRVAALSEGFVLPAQHLAVITEEEIFGPRERRRRAAALREGAAVEALAQLAPGDLLVHAEHGIGVYRGLVPLRVGPFEDEFLRLEYEGGDRLFVPVHRLNLVQRYVGSEGAAPKLDKLGGQTWERTRRHVKRKVRDMAKELLAVHAAREAAPGVAYPPRDRALEEFEAAFPFEETPDQQSAIEDVLEDLQRPRPMDRLVCGDVGYGKTEVAVRAAFQVMNTGRQVAVLVPTTVLAQQHLETFEKRFEGQPVRIATLSRFQTAKQARQVREDLALGRIDLVIGTHRLLQKGVEFHDLGLLVVDEEHRFGVAHKERIKQLKQTVDVLTLTATPIPRTLQMAFSGIRDLSVITTPPADRLSVRTQVCRFDESLVREAILREVQRGGQVFFVHNRVQTIGAIAELLRRLLPEVRVLVAHGQMPERELEDRMLAFLRGEAEVLLCTTIIESGLDIPRANTMLIDRADALGLAQLYQLRGRVGRSDRRAYAYLLMPGEAALSADARRRLEAIQDLAELGSGFRLASMDLEIRGAGNLLGAEQSGSLGAVGYETYMELLEEAILELRGREPAPRVDPEIRLPVPARLPEDYVPEVSQRLVLYKRLAGAPDEEALEGLRGELLDRYGPLPPETESLLGVIRLKIAARRLGVAKLEVERGDLVLTAAAGSRVDPARLVELTTSPEAGLRVLPDGRVRAPARGLQGKALFEAAHAVLARLARPAARASGG